MPLSPLNGKVLTPEEIKAAVILNGDNFVKLARKWKAERATPTKISRVVNRRAPFVYPQIRKRFADYLGVPVSAVGRPLADPEEEKRLAA
jgi:hypothetical protein